MTSQPRPAAPGTGAADGVDPLDVPAGFDPSRKFVRITGRRPDGFVEFDFAIGEPDVFVELVLSADAFAEFCAANRPEPLPEVASGAASPAETGDDCHPDQLDAASWRLSDAINRHL